MGSKMHRTQLYLTTEQLEELRRRSARLERSVSDLVREAIDEVYIEPRKKELGRALEQAFGVWKDREDVSDGRVYTRKLRKEWHRDPGDKSDHNE